MLLVRSLEENIKSHEFRMLFLKQWKSLIKIEMKPYFMHSL